jgi:L-aminopeptidase/D-esterase
MMKSGIGSAAYQIGDLKVGAVVCVNSAGDVYDPNTNQILAGAYDATKQQWLNSEEALYASLTNVQMGSNTSIGAVLTNSSFNKTELTKIAGMDGLDKVMPSPT